VVCNVSVINSFGAFIGAGVACPSYGVIGQYLQGGYLVINGNTAINSSNQFVGAGVLCPNNGVQCAGVNPYVGGVQYTGQNTSFQDLAGVTHLVRGGIIVS
jgi:hypothetical protein